MSLLNMMRPLLISKNSSLVAAAPSVLVSCTRTYAWQSIKNNKYHVRLANNNRRQTATINHDDTYKNDSNIT